MERQGTGRFSEDLDKWAQAIYSSNKPETL